MVLYSWGFFTLNIMITATNDNYKEVIQKVIDLLIDAQNNIKGAGIMSISVNKLLEADSLDRMQINIELVGKI